MPVLTPGLPKTMKSLRDVHSRLNVRESLKPVLTIKAFHYEKRHAIMLGIFKMENCLSK
jgi:hypothetical protein